MTNQARAVFTVIRVTPTGPVALGTAFAVAPHVLATAFHVTSGIEQGLHLFAPAHLGLDHYQDANDVEGMGYPVTLAEADPVRDLALLKVEDAVTLPYLNTISSTDALQVGQEVSVLGFPHADTGRTVLTYRKASIGARILIGNRGVKSKYAVVNLQGRPGQSGSPVLDNTGAVAAIIVGGYAPANGGVTLTVSGIDPTTLHETTHAVSAQYLKEMMA